ncbi:MAG: alpha/beta-type small acid-soluble spore protein [Bacilli bacterium]|nr:alpha/beta-type small acid-soluble spore protein [Bacilli bacterium]
MPKKNNASMKVKTPGAKKSVENMKYEIANEFGVNLGATASSRDNGIVGGEMTKRLVANAKGKKKRKSKKSN